MAKTLEELEQDFGGGGGGGASAKEAPKSLDDLETQFSKPRSGASVIPGAERRSGEGVKSGAADFEPGFMGSAKKALAQVGSGVSDQMLGIQQLIGNATEQDVADKRKLDAPLIDGPMGKVNHFIGAIAPSLAIPAIGGTKAAAMAYNALAGLLQGVTTPVGPGESRGVNGAAGMAGGFAAPAVIGAAANALRPASQEGTDLARKAVAMGIPVAASDTSTSPFAKALRSIMDTLPGTAGMGARHAEDVQQGINRAAGETMGMQGASKIDPAAYQLNKQRLSGEFDNIWKNTQIQYDANLFGGLQQLETKMNQVSPHVGNKFRADLDHLHNSVVQQPNGDLTIPGETVDSIQKGLGSIIGAGGPEADVAKQFKGELLGALNRSAPPGTAEALANTKRQWGAMKTLEPLLAKGEAGVVGRESGDVPASLLPGRVAQQYGPNVSTSPFSDLSPIAGRFGVNRTPQTGGSLRALMQGGMTSAAAGVGALAATGSPGAAATLAGASLLIPTLGMLTQKAMTSPALQRKLLAEPVRQTLLGTPALGPALRGMGSTALSRLPASGALGAVGWAGNRSQPSTFEQESADFGEPSQ